MQFVLPTFAKLNLTLRVTGRRPDGYHDIVSTFLRIPSGEELWATPEPRGVGGDLIQIRDLDLDIPCENTVAKALRLAREAGSDVPWLWIEIRKSLHPGSGLGAGSGNAAAVLQWLAAWNTTLPWMDVARRTGADVPFLFSGLPMALVTGTGDCIEPLPPIHLRGVVVLPEWEVGTSGAYEALDAALNGKYPMDETQAREEADRILTALDVGERVGLLPNDFAPPLIKAHPQYEELFGLFEDMDALAWGITGSGSAAFAILRGRCDEPKWPGWVRQVLSLPPQP